MPAKKRKYAEFNIAKNPTTTLELTKYWKLDTPQPGLMQIAGIERERSVSPVVMKDPTVNDFKRNSATAGANSCMTIQAPSMNVPIDHSPAGFRNQSLLTTHQFEAKPLISAINQPSAEDIVEQTSVYCEAESNSLPMGMITPPSGFSLPINAVSADHINSTIDSPLPLVTNSLEPMGAIQAPSCSVKTTYISVIKVNNGDPVTKSSGMINSTSTQSPCSTHLSLPQGLSISKDFNDAEELADLLTSQLQIHGSVGDVVVVPDVVHSIFDAPELVASTVNHGPTAIANLRNLSVQVDMAPQSLSPKS